MSADKVAKAKQALSALQEQLFDASSMLSCLGRALDADGHDDPARAANAIGVQVARIAMAFDGVLV